MIHNQKHVSTININTYIAQLSPVTTVLFKFICLTFVKLPSFIYLHKYITILIVLNASKTSAQIQ